VNIPSSSLASRPAGAPTAVAAQISPQPVQSVHSVHPAHSDDSTRNRVAQAVSELGPVTASDLAERLGLTSAAVRRHLDNLEHDELVRTLEIAPVGRRGRGRPARAYVLTDAGHTALSSEYDDLAASALRFLATEIGPDAVERFAESRVSELEARYAPVVAAAGPDVAARTDALAAALSADGYAASVRPMGSGGVQLCQGHCPVQHVAAAFPQLCEAETEAFARLLGGHVQRLATLAHGEHVCTTYVPTPTATSTTPVTPLTSAPPTAGKDSDDHR
jgi:predicted ArsR family transcriptional regulator